MSPTPLTLPPDHELRRALADEVHARPYEALPARARCSYLALLTGAGDSDAIRQAVARLCADAMVTPPAADASHYSGDLGGFRLKWERHSEYHSLMFIVADAGDDPFAEPALAAVPSDWLAALPGQVVAAAHAALLPESPEPLEMLAARYFAGNTLVGSEIGGGAATAYTDFRIHQDGASRFLVHGRSLTTRQAGRMVQRLFEIDTYRVLALLAFPVARELLPVLSQADAGLNAITASMLTSGEEDEPRLLEDLTRLAAKVEQAVSSSEFRMSAAAAYYRLVDRRIEELREERIQGTQTFREFMERRLAPAIHTCGSVAERLDRLSRRVGRASQLLSTRVDITRERQNQQLLASMNRRAKLQLRLQETVEGLSIAAITYYIAGLVGYGAKAAKALGLPVNPELATGIAIPVVLIAVALGMRHVRKMVMGTQ